MGGLREQYFGQSRKFLRRVHLSNRTHPSTVQPYRAGPEAAEAGPKRAPKDTPRMFPGMVSRGPSSRASLGEVSPALGSAL